MENKQFWGQNSQRIVRNTLKTNVGTVLKNNCEDCVHKELSSLDSQTIVVTVFTDMRIVASIASMLEEPYLRIEEPNPLMAEWNEAGKQQKKTSMRLHHWVSLNEAGWLLLPHWACITVAASLNQSNWAAQWGCLTLGASLRLPYCGYLTEATSLRLVDCWCIIEAASLWLSHWGSITVATSLNQPHWAAHWSCLTVASLM